MMSYPLRLGDFIFHQRKSSRLYWCTGVENTDEVDEETDLLGMHDESHSSNVEEVGYSDGFIEYV